jgi:predicted GH43/DUF377 family glycosyl hydrolase
MIRERRLCGGGSPLELRRLPIELESDVRRVIPRFFDPGGMTRIDHVIERVAELPEAEVERILGQVLEGFRGRHPNVEATLQEHYETARALSSHSDGLSRPRRLLAGSYFTMEYSLEGAALFNPSIIPHHNQNHLPDGALRFILSMRATGEGHVSSIVFRTGVIHADGALHMDPPSRVTQPLRVAADARYDKALFARKLLSLAAPNANAERLLLDRLEDTFTRADLERAIASAQQANAGKGKGGQSPFVRRPSEDGARLRAVPAKGDCPLFPGLAATIRRARWLAQANYQLELSRDAEAAQVVLFPHSTSERGGIEDLRMVRLVEDDGSVAYFGTYTAYDGYHTLPQLLETRDFLRLGVHTLHGARAQNKGMALFPRRIGGQYAMCSRVDGENLYLMFSDHVEFWDKAELLQTPRRPWELVQMGNCGSPLETPEGWLLLTHGVGPMRTYGIGAMLLDLDDPLKVRGVLDEPLLLPAEDERDGYVPNVVYTCGALIHNDRLYLPFATADRVTRFAFLPLGPLLERLVR